MDEYPISVEVILKTGHKSAFGAFEFKQTPQGWEFTSYPEKRGYKSVRVVKADAIAAIEITAPGQFFEAATLHAQPPVASATPVPTGPQTYTAPKVNRSIPLPDKDGKPRAAVPIYDKEGNEMQIDIGAAMVG